MSAAPDWLVPGAEVAEVTERTSVDGRGGRIVYTTVDRVLTRDVVLANGHRFRLDRLSKSAGTWDPTTYLVPRDDERVVRVREANRRIKARGKVDAAYALWRRDRTVVNADALIECVEAWKAQAS